VIAAGAGAAPGNAQTVLAAAAEGRSAPGAAAVVSLVLGARVAVVATKGPNALVMVDGWVDASRLAGKIDTFPASVDMKAPLRVHATAGTKGAVLGELRSRVGVTTLGKSGTWMHVKRGAWIPAAALAKPAATADPKPAAPKPGVLKSVAPKPVVPAAALRQGGDAPVMPGAMSASAAMPLLNAPQGKSVGDIAAGTIVMPLAHDHGWTKVRVEGWVPDRQLAPADTSLGSQLTAADLRADPDATRGKMVQWDVEVLSLQTADPLRPEFARDEPYLLAKGPGTEDALLYLAVPPSLLAQARALPPLTRVLITARVRSGHSEPVGVPILDLRSIAKR
jgi:hypothetical protein